MRYTLSIFVKALRLSSASFLYILFFFNYYSGYMKKVVYFHGLESKQGGVKVDLLTRHFLSYAPSMNYEDQAIWKTTLKNVQKI